MTRILGPNNLVLGSSASNQPQPRNSMRETLVLVPHLESAFLSTAALSTRLWPGVLHSIIPQVWAKADLSLRVEVAGCFVGINACGPGRHLPSLAGHCWRQFSSPQHSHCCYNAHIHLNWLQREGEKPHTGNNKCKFPSVLRTLLQKSPQAQNEHAEKFLFFLKTLWYGQGQRSLLFLSLSHQGSLSRSVLSPLSTPCPDSITRPSWNSDIAGSTTKQPGPGERE